MALSSTGQLHDTPFDSPKWRFPKAIAHRGYSARYPENTMSAFTAAVHAGAHMLETDVHLSKDDVVVLSHDPTLKRCFGRPGKIVDHDWRYLSKLKCLKEPHEGMPRLLDLLEYLAAPGLDSVGVLLDIKADNNLDNAFRLIARAIHETPPSSRPWTNRIVLGCWAAEYLPLCAAHLPGFAITHIGLDICYARQFLEVPGVSFAMPQEVLVGRAGGRFVRDARAAGRAVFVWTVNERSMMRRCIRMQVDGVITDDPAMFLQVCEEYDGRYGDEDALAVRMCLRIVVINVFVTLFGAFFRWRYGFRGRRLLLSSVWS